MCSHMLRPRYFTVCSTKLMGTCTPLLVSLNFVLAAVRVSAAEDLVERVIHESSKSLAVKKLQTTRDQKRFIKASGTVAIPLYKPKYVKCASL